mmetsp:Transcript_38992/g.117232  ORF Transcript_38992/g.117232 Transcript_38992/m.117232 type:complete len:249 (-) Transcript_38992:176-922(-)
MRRHRPPSALKAVVVQQSVRNDRTRASASAGGAPAPRLESRLLAADRLGPHNDLGDGVPRRAGDGPHDAAQRVPVKVRVVGRNDGRAMLMLHRPPPLGPDRRPPRLDQCPELPPERPKVVGAVIQSVPLVGRGDGTESYLDDRIGMEFDRRSFPHGFRGLMRSCARVAAGGFVAADAGRVVGVIVIGVVVVVLERVREGEFVLGLLGLEEGLEGRRRSAAVVSDDYSRRRQAAVDDDRLGGRGVVACG